MRTIIQRLMDLFDFAILKPSGKEWLIELNGVFYTIPTINVSNIIGVATSDTQAKKYIMDSMTEFNLIDSGETPFEELRDSFVCNGFAYENKKAYKSKSNKVCYISENSEDISDVESWLSMYVEAMKFLLDKNTLLNILEQNDADELIEKLEAQDESKLNFGWYESYYKNGTGTDINSHARSLIDSFWEQGEKWQSFSTYLDSYFI